MRSARYIFYSLVVFLTSSCTTSPVTGGRKLLGIPVPFTKPDTPPQHDPKMTETLAVIEQFAPFQWAALALIVGGAFVWFWTKGSSGFGRFMCGLGIGLSVFAVVMPKIAGWIGIIAILGLLVLAGYLIYKYIVEKKEG